MINTVVIAVEGRLGGIFYYFNFDWILNFFFTIFSFSGKNGTIFTNYLYSKFKFNNKSLT